MHTISDIIQFDLPEKLACPEPTEIRKIARDDARLLVTNNSGSISHTTFKQLTNHLLPGDVLVVNTSATVPAAFPVALPFGKKGVIHFSTRIDNRNWLAEIRVIKNNQTVRWKGGKAGMVFLLPGNARVRLKDKFYGNRDLLHLWTVELTINQEAVPYMTEFGQPIKYLSLDKPYPIDYYQTMFSSQPGSSEMPSAGRGFTAGLVDRLMQKGISFAPVLLHTGVSSLEENEAPYPEYMEVEPISAAIINNAKRKGGRIIAVGTTAVRAIESAADETGLVSPFKGKTSLYIRNGYSMKTVDGLLTGFHEPKASHLNMLQSLAGFDHMERAYTAAIENNYFWHQFGDLHLILP
ncbi:MAG: S-adenosylmethionine:tRNA ribosyltransferase-isomerase [Bacteroidota bacterium]